MWVRCQDGIFIPALATFNKFAVIIYLQFLGAYPQNTQENSKMFACGGLNYLKFLIKNCIE